MNHLRFDSVGGASGDMILGALIDLGVDPATLRSGIGTLGVESFELEVRTLTAGGQRGTQVTVKVADEHHPHRHLHHIQAIIDSSRLDPTVKQMSIQVFERLAAAEATVHGSTPEAIHFHEVGAMDAIVDITGSCLALSLLNIDAVSLSPLPLGAGSTTCAHGVMPLPVPATAELLKGFSVIQTDEPFELVTPTGAALLTTWRCMLPPPERPSEVILQQTGTGIGHRSLNNRPNLLRAALLTSSPSGPAPGGDCCVLECNLDDTNPELLGSLAEKLIEEGALDAFMTPTQMKKQRPGIVLTVLSRPEDRERLADLIFEESTTFGIREHTVRRMMLERRHECVKTPYGQVRVKIGSCHGKDITWAPEHADCVQGAKQHHVPIRRVYEAAIRKT